MTADLPLTEQNSTASDLACGPLYVKLDGALVKSNTLADSFLVLVRTHPRLLFEIATRILRGTSALRSFLSESISLDVAHLPYNRELIDFLRAEHAKGREIYLTTDSEGRLAERIAQHLDIFHGILILPTGTGGLSHEDRLRSMKQHAGGSGFSYVGNARSDLNLLSYAIEPMIVNPSFGASIGMKVSGIQPARTFNDKTKPLPLFAKTIRLHQWAKNFLVFFPVLLAHSFHLAGLLRAAQAFICFSLTASAAYILNDLLDIQADRHHSSKRQRAFASGDLSVISGLITLALFLVIATLGAFWTAPKFALWLWVYFATTLAYSLILKRVALVDVTVLAGLYTLRLQAGGAATGTPISHWLACFSILLFFSLAVVKRFVELEDLRTAGLIPKNGRGYQITDLEQLRAIGTASAFAAVVVFANYISAPEVTSLYHKPGFLWLVMPLMLLWLSRVWLLASRGKLNEDPVVFALTNRLSLLIGAIIATIALVAE